MTSKHSLQGLMKWLTREQWHERFSKVLEDHLLPASSDTGLDAEEIISRFGEDWFMSTVWACAFEDFLTREFEDSSNIVDDYLKRRGWKESASVRTYMAALRTSEMSLYEVSDIVQDTSFRARDLVRGGEPVLISERSATRYLKQWDRIAARVVRIGSQTLISGAVLPYERGAAEELIASLQKFAKLTKKEKQALADAVGQSFDNSVITDLSRTELLRTLSPVFTAIWLVDLIDRAMEPEVLRNAEGDELALCIARFPFAADTKDDDIRAALERCPELRQGTATFWNWVSSEKPARDSGVQKQSPESLTLITTLDDGSLSLGNVELEDKTLVLSVNSRARSDRGRALLSETLGRLVGQPLVETQTLEQVMASREAGPSQSQKLDIPEEERSAIIHDSLDRHYRALLDQPIPMLGDKSPRAAARTAKGRAQIADWLKMMENQNAKSAHHNSAMANYSFSWLWKELGVDKLRR